MNATGASRPDVPPETVVAAQAGDERAFEAIVAHYRQPILRMARAITRDATHAEDVAQDVFLRLWRGLATFQTWRPFRPWLMKLARNACLNAIGRKRLPTVSVHAGEDENGVPELADASPTAHEVAASRELVSRLNEAIAQLPPRYRDVITLRHLEGQSYRQIARSLGRPSGTVKVWLFRARERLRRLLAPSVHPDGALA